MIYRAQVVGLDDDIEELVTLQINGVILNCFASVCPYPIEKGRTYPVRLQLVVLGNDEVVELADPKDLGFVEIGVGFGYQIHGRLDGMRLIAGGLVFEDEALQVDFGHLDGKFVMVKVDRIDVEFLAGEV